MSAARHLAKVWRRRVPAVRFGLRRNDDGDINWPFYFILAIATAMFISAVVRTN